MLHTRQTSLTQEGGFLMQWIGQQKNGRIETTMQHDALGQQQRLRRQGRAACLVSWGRGAISIMAPFRPSETRPRAQAGRDALATPKPA